MLLLYSNLPLLIASPHSLDTLVWDLHYRFLHILPIPLPLLTLPVPLPRIPLALVDHTRHLRMYLEALQDWEVTPALVTRLLITAALLLRLTVCLHRTTELPLLLRHPNIPEEAQGTPVVLLATALLLHLMVHLL